MKKFDFSPRRVLLNAVRVRFRRLPFCAKISLIASFAASTCFAASTISAQGAEPISSSNPEVAASPFGVCSHLGGGEEHSQMPENLEKMRAAGIVWARADFSWTGVESPQGTWNFDRLDRVVEETQRNGIQILPILNYDAPWATPAYRHLDAWNEYVRRVVERYRDKIQYWEVYNEPNLEGFWRETPNGANYAALLKETYRTIKSIDTNLVVVYGGLAGVPIDYFEATLDAGAGEYFDVMNVHPYRGGMTSRRAVERFADDLDAFDAALAKRGLEKPIWITEMGWATPPVFGEINVRVVGAALQKLFPENNGANGDVGLPKIAFFYDERYEPAAATTRQDLFKLLPAGYKARTGAGRGPANAPAPQNLVSFLDANALSTLEPNDVPVLILPPSETFPADRFDALVQYVKNGGVLVLLGGVPLYYRSEIGPDGFYRQQRDNPQANENWEALRISWFAWWTRQNVPKEVSTVVAPDAAQELDGFYPVVKGTRFFDDKRLRPGDKMIPLLLGKNETFSAPSACVYQFGSDYRGAVVVSALFDENAGQNVSTVADQAVFLPQSYLLAFANGVERYFWYEFQAPQRDPVDKEHHFGIVGQTLEPKPAYFAYQALTKALPAGSKNVELELTDDFCVVSWTRPDGQKGWALWAPRDEKTTTLQIEGTVDAAFDYLGGEVEKPASGAVERTLEPGILYLIGPTKIELK